MKSIFRKICSGAFVALKVLLIGLSVFAIFRADFYLKVINPPEPKFTSGVKNVVLMIGDGMGKKHINAATDYYGEELYMEKLYYEKGSVTTRSYDSIVTDSAAAATALSCGEKTNNKQVARRGNDDIMNMCEYMKAFGMKVGVTVTEGITGATPAAFTSHAKSRGDKKDIFSSQMKSGTDLFIGADKTFFDENKGSIEANGYKYYNDLNRLERLTSRGKIFVAVDKFNAYGETENDYPTITEAADIAFDILNNDNENGFFLMVEGSHIDKRSHANDLLGMLRHLKQFDITVERIVQKATADGDTLVIVTADHETGNLIYFNGDEFTDKLFHSGGHTAKDVNYYLFGKNCLRLGSAVDNTTIAKAIRKCVAAYPGRVN